MKNYKIVVQYDGTKYKGWQMQRSTDLTIQGKLQHILESICNEPVEVIGSGRTDAGVHAKGQVANFHMNWNNSEEELLFRINGYLPNDIAVISLEEVEERFHSRFNAKDKIYRYRIHTSAISDVFERKFQYHLEEKLNVEAMREAAEYCCGEHDFTSFCGNRKFKKSAVRTIYSITITEVGREIQIDYCGDGFLQNMVRILTGTLIEVGRGERRPEDMKDIIEGKNRDLAGYTAPAEGLCLLEVHY